MSKKKIFIILAVIIISLVGGTILNQNINPQARSAGDSLYDVKGGLPDSRFELPEDKNTEEDQNLNERIEVNRNNLILR